MNISEEEKELFFKHYHLLDTVYPHVLRFILNKICPLDSGETFFHKLRKQYPSMKKFKDSLYPEQFKKLKKNLCNSFDTTLLCKLIRELCPEDVLRSWLNDDCRLGSGETYYDKLVDKYGSDEKVMEKYTQITVLKSQDPSLFNISLITELVKDLCPHYTFNESLKKVKRRRNNISHDCFEDKIKNLGNRAAVEESKCFVLILLDDAKQGFRIDHKDINAEKSKVNIKWHKILNDDLILYGDESSLRHYYRDVLEMRGIKLHGNITLPIIDDGAQIHITSSFSQLKLITKEKEEVVQLPDLLSHFDNTKRCSVISGPAGAGKTTLLKYLYNQWAQMKYDTFNQLEKYELVFFIQCRDDDESLKMLLRKWYFAAFSRDTFDYNRFLCSLKKQSVLILIDGLDEINEKSLKVVKEVVSEFDMSNVVITSRPEGKDQHLWQITQGQAFNDVKIDGIKNMKEFVMKLWDTIAKGSTKPVEMFIEKIDSLPGKTKEILSLPLNLLLYIYLYKTSDNDAFLDINLGCDLLHKLNQHHINYLARKIGNSSDFVKMIKYLVQKIERISYNLLLENRLTLSHSDCSSLIKECETGRFKDCEHTVIASFLSYKRQDVTKDHPTYAFPHKQFQEYMAARYIQRQLVSNPAFINQLAKKKTELYKTNLMLLALIAKPDEDDDYAVTITSNIVNKIIRLVLITDGDDTLQWRYVEQFLLHLRGSKHIKAKVTQKFTCKQLKTDWRDDSPSAHDILHALRYVQPKKLDIKEYTFQRDDNSFVQLLDKCKRRFPMIGQITIEIIHLTLHDCPLLSEVLTRLHSAPICICRMEVANIKSDSNMQLLKQLKKKNRNIRWLEITLYKHCNGLDKIKDQVSRTTIYYEKQGDVTVHFILKIIGDLFSPNTRSYNQVYIKSRSITQDDYDQIKNYLIHNNTYAKVNFSSDIFKPIKIFTPEMISNYPVGRREMNIDIDNEDQITALSESQWMKRKIKDGRGWLNITLSKHCNGLDKIKDQVNITTIYYEKQGDVTVHFILEIIGDLFSPNTRSYHEVYIKSRSITQDDYDRIKNYIIHNNIRVIVLFSNTRFKDIYNR